MDSRLQATGFHCDVWRFRLKNNGRGLKARIGELVGHSDLVTTARVYTHVVADEAELDYAGVLE
jgi:integrase